MTGMKLNKKSLYQEGGMISKSSSNPAIDELSKVVKARIDSGETAEQVLYSFFQEGVSEEQLALAFESVGYDPSLFRQLMQNVEKAIMQTQQMNQMQMSQTPSMQEESQETFEEEMEYGGMIKPNKTPRPLYMPVMPEESNLINAAFLLADAGQQFFNRDDKNKDGLKDGSFRDMAAKRQRYKDKQLQNRTYDVDFKGLDPKDYVITWKDLAEGKLRTKEEVESMSYGGDLPKAQTGNLEQLRDFLSNIGQTNYMEDIRAVQDAQLQKRFPGLNTTPQQKLNENISNIGMSQEDEVIEPKIRRRRNLGNAFDSAEMFIKEDPDLQAFGDLSQFAVMGANFANEFFKQREFDDYRNKLRNTTIADNVYLATENPSNKRGTFDVNLGLAEPDNLVPYYAQAMYGKETYKKGGEFVAHMMYDPISGKGYEAKVEADHNRFAKMGFVHEDEMQIGGEVEVDNDTLAALIAAGADIEML